jgi:hypothetical protein
MVKLCGLCRISTLGLPKNVSDVFELTDFLQQALVPEALVPEPMASEEQAWRRRTLGTARSQLSHDP